MLASLLVLCMRVCYPRCMFALRVYARAASHLDKLAIAAADHSAYFLQAKQTFETAVKHRLTTALLEQDGESQARISAFSAPCCLVLSQKGAQVVWMRFTLSDLSRCCCCRCAQDAFVAHLGNLDSGVTCELELVYVQVSPRYPTGCDLRMLSSCRWLSSIPILRSI
jgi:hypothetical protein